MKIPAGKQGFIIKMENQTSIKNIYAELRRIARNEVIKELEQEAVKEKDFKTLEQLQKMKEETQ